jgi:uncharacterized Fe-S cluster protein YjdI
MIRNGCECCTGMMVHHDIVKGTVQQGMKKYTGEELHLPRKEKILSHVGEVLRQAEGANVVRGGWIGVDIVPQRGIEKKLLAIAHSPSQ